MKVGVSDTGAVCRECDPEHNVRPLTRSSQTSGYDPRGLRRTKVKTKTALISVAVLAVAVLSGCHGENSITGTSTGTRVLAGEVQMVGNLAGQSPAGVNVTAP